MILASNDAITTPNICLSECKPIPLSCTTYSGCIFFNFLQCALKAISTCCGVNLLPVFVTKKKGCFGFLLLSGIDLTSDKVSKNKFLYILLNQNKGNLSLYLNGIGVLNPIFT